MAAIALGFELSLGLSPACLSCWYRAERRGPVMLGAGGAALSTSGLPVAGLSEGGIRFEMKRLFDWLAMFINREVM